MNIDLSQDEQRHGGVCSPDEMTGKSQYDSTGIGEGGSAKKVQGQAIADYSNEKRTANKMRSPALLRARECCDDNPDTKHML